jgi:hypothetical protein
MRAAFVSAAVIAVLAIPSQASAADVVDATTDFDGPATHRRGLILGTSLGFGAIGASGYPNNSTEIGDPTYYGASGLMTGSSSSLLIMGALTDYVNFGIWFGRQSAQNGDWRSSGGAGGFRVEGFPLFRVVPKLRDLGVFSQFGIGSATLDEKNSTYVGAKGVQSFLGAGAFYEWSLGHLLGGHAAIGPSLEYDSIWSRSIETNGMVLGLRLVWYGGT